ncbi:hypothetical protein HR45_15190 [Shewanella mangrovi]|uniref:Lipoprotein n=1 Tax=Shewanella mangrovi TaxID=1515746 RepID=A0A094JF22_9GAMM|nr:DUF4919 domain-containing protein [Shewanella mangrovi]KFZ36639.1 hypothetical protein HR45_15190 [Shewanella mangrovi]
MKSLLILVMGLLLSACSSLSNPAPTSKINWADDVDFDAMRMMVGWADNYQQRCRDGRPLEKIYDLADAGDWQQLATIGEQWLQQCPIDIRIHYMTSMAIEQIGAQDSSDDHYRWFDGLMESLVSSGDGTSPKTAYVTISVQEEYDAMYFFQVRPTAQRLFGEPLCDEIQVVDSNGDKMVLYFNPAAHFSRLAKKRTKSN